ncbi:hypothetical protein FRX31_019249 [Thalictrum thalictroides]|uniref:Uncharacterized protein n=1 Tax=Thalictrum thalictroides TaxID=46969 RepID=A0A7J6W1U9_THATH|nr:hypothetical protein FRX31_019249 [Thalictrum thalictroides]
MLQDDDLFCRRSSNNGRPSQFPPLENHPHHNGEEARNPSQNSTTSRRERSRAREASIAASSQPPSNKGAPQNNEEELAIRAEKLRKKNHRIRSQNKDLKKKRVKLGEGEGTEVNSNIQPHPKQQCNVFDRIGQDKARL